MPMRVPWILTARLCALPAGAGVYKWKDKDGRIHYTDKPPADVKADSVRAHVSSIKGPPVLSDFAPKPAAAPAGDAKVRMFTTQSCGYCRWAKAYLDRRGTAYEELDVEASAAAYDEYRALGGRGVPVILVGNKRMSGFSADRLEGLLRDAGL